MWERQKTAIVGQLLTVIAFPVLSGAVMAERRVEHFVPLNHFRDCDGWSEMVVVPTGSYQMGATEEEFRGAEKKYQFMHGIETPRHTVQVKSFALARFHVTASSLRSLQKRPDLAARAVASSSIQTGNLILMLTGRTPVLPKQTTIRSCVCRGTTHNNISRG